MKEKEEEIEREERKFGRVNGEGGREKEKPRKGERKRNGKKEEERKFEESKNEKKVGMKKNEIKTGRDSRMKHCEER